MAITLSDLLIQLDRRFAEGAATDVNINRDLELITLGMLSEEQAEMPTGPVVNQYQFELGRLIQRHNKTIQAATLSISIGPVSEKP